MSRIDAVKNVTAIVRACSQLGHEGKEQVVAALLLEIPKIEVKIRHGGQSSLANSHDVLDDRGTGKKI